MVAYFFFHSFTKSAVFAFCGSTGSAIKYSMGGTITWEGLNSFFLKFGEQTIHQSTYSSYFSVMGIVM